MRVIRVAPPLDQADRVDQEGADDRRVQALVVQHQHRLVQAGARIHDETAGAGLRQALTEVGRDEAQAVHQRQVEVGEGRHRAAAAVGGQAGDRGPLEQERQQLGLREDARHQLAVLEVVARQGRFVLGEAAIDLRHPLVGVVDRLALPQQRLRHVLQAERGEVPGRRAQRLDAVDDQPPSGLGEEVAVAAAMFAPAHLVATAPQAQRHLQALGVIAQYAQIELHQVPADDGIGVMPRQPVVEPLQ
ncbi:hypothetical protein D3C80_1210460 [compost metagenome]